MRVFLLRNTGITRTRTIEHNNDFTIVEDFLSKTSNYDIGLMDDESISGLSKRTLTKLKSLSFTETFNDNKDNGGLDILKINEYDSAIVKGYKLFPNISKTFWRIKNVIYISGGQYTLDFELDISTTFGISLLDFSNSKPKFERKHIAYKKQFFDLENYGLNSSSILREHQPKGEEQIFYHPTDVKLTNPAIEEIKAKWGFEYWIVFTMRRDGVEGETENIDLAFSTRNNTNTDSRQRLETASFQVFVPISNQDITIELSDGDGTITMNGYKTYSINKGNPALENARIIDWPPVNDMYIDGDKLIVPGILNFGDIDKEVAIISPEISKDKSRTPLHIPQDEMDRLFDWVPAESDFEIDGENQFETKHILDLEFFPFKEFEIGFYSEYENSGWTFENNMLRYLIKKNAPLFYRSFAFGENDWGVVDVLTDAKDSYGLQYGSAVNKIKRTLQYPLFNDVWKEYTQQRLVQGAQQFLIPVGVGFLNGGIKGGLAGAGIASVSTALRNIEMKNKPDTAQGSADIINIEQMEYFDTKAIKVKQLQFETRNRIAFEFHKFGTYHYNNNIKIESIEDLLPNERFNYLKLSKIENLEILKNKNLPEIVLKSFLDVLKTGITYWVWGNDQKDATYPDLELLPSSTLIPAQNKNTIRNTLIFNYNIKNPEKE